MPLNLSLWPVLNEVAMHVPLPFIVALTNVAATLQLTGVYMKVIHSLYRMKIVEIGLD